MLSFERLSTHGRDRISFTCETLIVGGWTGRNVDAQEHHMRELESIGVARPSTVPLFYRCAASTVTQTARLEVLGNATSGEAEFVIVSLADGLWVTVGSDHTDRQAETQGVALSKQLCGKVLSGTLWKLDDVRRHWDQLVLRSFIIEDSKEKLYQEGRLAALLPPDELISRWGGGVTLPPGTIMFGGTVSALGGIRPSSTFRMELEDTILQRKMGHVYATITLPVVS